MNVEEDTALDAPNSADIHQGESCSPAESEVFPYLFTQLCTHHSMFST
jgi:hypothetical protein